MRWTTWAVAVGLMLLAVATPDLAAEEQRSAGSSMSCDLIPLLLRNAFSMGGYFGARYERWSGVGKFVQGGVVTKSWRALKTCYEEHYAKGQKVLGCPVSGWCDKK